MILVSSLKRQLHHDKFTFKLQNTMYFVSHNEIRYKSENISIRSLTLKNNNLLLLS